ncbi:uncharacterized protein EI90DRAFT_2928749 [Cantharellus anzutake]|uniref:uncharacterized protein n=1 Tax=Cantharellus anzutake TaxID=1750568 RepID=UPI0019046F89|nr:uncharacterized protein EI90DRAFT_2928749 [Cantharellus anzutake]KAF8327172.1 hypothetical protein EI90DRAFT_2928749 [Cantharellus anzutake]
MASTAFSTIPSPLHPNVKFAVRLSQERGHADHGWLKTFHTFNFASYYHPDYDQFGNLRVINEDRVDPSSGFGKHPHREMEIFSYIVSGELEHKDSMGNVEILKRGDVQMTSAGTGITHSEFNRNTSQVVHFLQIWVTPSTFRLKPSYYTRHFTDAAKTNNLLKIVAPIPSGAEEAKHEDVPDSSPAPIHQNFALYASILTPDSNGKVTYSFAPSPSVTRNVYIHVIQTSGYSTKPTPEIQKGVAKVEVNGGVVLGEGDGLFAVGSGTEGEGIVLVNMGDVNAEVLLFEA